MKKINLIKGLWSDSHEKQTPQRFGRYAVMLLMLLTLGVGQMWAKTVYIDISSFTDYNSQIYVHYWGSGEAYKAASSAGTNLYKVDNVPDGASWQVLRSNGGSGDGDRYNYQNNCSSSDNIYHVTGWNNSGSSEQLDILPKQKYIYFDVSGSNADRWRAADFNTKFNWYSVNGVFSSATWCKSKLSDGVYYTQVPNTDHLGQVQLCRMNPSNDGDEWNSSGTAKADNDYNCLYVKSENKDWWNTWIPGWTTYAPPLSSVSLSDNGTAILAGGGTESNPYLIATGATIKVIASGTKAVADPDATIWYDIKDNTTSKQNSSTAACSFTASATANTVYQMKVDGYTKVSSTSSTKLTSDIIYYKTVSVKDISVYIYVGGHSDGDINSVEMNGCTPYVGTKALTAVKINNRAAGDPKFTLSGNWLYYTFTNVTKVSNITCARSGGNIFTGEITDNVYYTYEGTSLPGQCIQPANPTWGTAPASGAIGGSMTANVSGAPDGATITWSSTDGDVASVNSSTGVISYEAAGSATIKANVSWSASGDYCAGSYELSQAITVTSGATVSATRACPEYVSTNSGQVKLDISSTGASTGWYYRVCNSTKTAYYAPDEQSAASNTLSWTMNGSLPTGSNTLVVELYNSARQLVCTSSSVTVNVEIAESVTISAGANGSVSPSGTVYANNNHVHPTITAIPDEHYHFKNWTSSNAAASVADANNATTTVTATASGYTITANFAGDQYSITYKDQGDVAYSGSNEGSLPATHTYGTATALVNGTKNGYNFVGWYTDASCTISAGSSIGATAKTSNFTLYAKWTENMSALSTSCSYDAGNPGYSAPTVSNSATNVGYVTTRTITATAAGTGYTFAGWTLTNCTRTDGGGATANPITIRSNGDGAAVSVVANYNEVLTTNWYISGDGNGTGTNLTPGSPFSGWGTSGTRMQKKSGYSTVEKYYCTFNVTTLATTDDHFPFQVYDGTNHRGYNGYWITKENNSTTVYTNNPTNMKFRPYIAGTYEFEVDNTGANPVLTVHWPVINQLRISSASPADATNINNFDLADKGSNNWSVKRTLNANTTYTFKMVYDGAWYGDGHAFTRASNTTTGLGDGGNMTLKTDVAGEYTFTFNSSSKNLEITYPAAYTVTYGVGTNYTSMGSVSTSPSISSGDYVIAGTSITFTATSNLGYKFVGWYSDDACTSSLSTDNPYTFSVTAAKTVYAKFELMNIKINSDVDGVWPTPWSQQIMSHSPGSPAVYTYSTTLTTRVTEQDAAPYNSGYHFNFLDSNDGELYNFNNVEPTYSGSSIDGVRKTADGNPTIQFGLTRKSDVTITLTLKTAPTKPTVSIAADPYYTITYGVPTHGSYTIKVGSAAAVGASTESTAGKTITLVPSASTGYHFDSWTVTKAGGGTVTVISNQFTMPSDDVTIAATFLPTSYDVTLKPNGATTGSDQVVRATFDAAMPTTTKSSVALAAPTKTGYTLQGFYQNSDGTGTKYYNANMTSANAWDQAGDANVWAKWQANPYVVTLDVDEVNQGTISGATTSQDVTYDGATTTVPNRPTAANGYALDGYYTDHNGEGVKVINGDGTWIASVAGYTDGSKHWVHDGEVTLYAYYKKAEITDIAFGAGAVVENGSTVTVTATISPTPTGTTTICWRVLHDDTGNPLDPQPTFTPSAQGNSVSFTAPNESGMYKVEAKLHTGSSCGGGTLLDTEVASFQVAGSHTVTVAYKYSSTTIKASTSVTGRPLAWSDPITAPDIFGYTFDHWTAGDGITLSENGTRDLGDDESDEVTIYIKATYNGTLTANYTPKNIVYFKDNLGWTDPDDENAHIYVNLLQSDYWDNDRGSGNYNRENRNLEMSRVPGTTDIFYYEYNDKSTSNYISFTKESMGNSGDFYQAAPNFAHVVFPSRSLDDLSTNKSTGLGFYAATPMFVPLATQTPVKKNSGRAAYYNDGYWTKYLPGTGYSLDIYQSDGKTRVKIVEFTSADELMPMKVTTDLEGGHTYKFQLKRDGDVYYGNSGTMTYNDHGQNTAWEFNNSPFSMCTIETNAAGNYTFNLSFSPNSGGTNNRLRISVDYPVASGDYRLVYTDDVHTKIHPSAIVPKENNGTAIVSFFVRKDAHPVVRLQQATVNPSTGAITWNEYPNSGTPTNQITGTIESAITAGGTEVYNFNLSMNESGAMTVASAEIYEGNFYIRTDAANSKWDNYRTDPDHLMTYSEYSIEHGGYTHYYTHWVDKDVTGRKNVKFVIANDYSPCISDTLIRETATGTWANIDKFIEEGGDLKRSANVRFMWDKRDNSISRAYIDGAQGDYSSNFLYMLNVEGGADKIKKEDDTALTDHKVTFKDNGNWMYEANIKAQPEAQIKLLSNWGTSNTITQYFRGAADDTETLIGGSGSTWYDIRLIYDFKTNRLIAGLIPSGTIDDQMAIHADVMFVREHQGDIAQLTFAEKAGKMGAITDIETAYGVLQFNKWTLNNKSKADGHSPLSPLLSAYERDLFYVSFPFRVSMEEVFGFGTYGTHWIIEEYDGASRAANGYWQESGPNWKFVFNRKNKFFEPGQGYIIALDLDELGESSDVWTNTDQVELYFPSYGTMDNITSSTATYEIPSHLCTINRTVDASGNPTGLPADYDRRVKDSHWNVLGVPTYVNPLAPNFANTDWTTSASETSIGPNFLYQVNWTDNSVSPVSASGYTYHAMHAYLVQYCGDVTWTSSVSVAPSDIVARRMSAEKPQNVEFKMELSQNDKMVDQTFIKLSDDENVTTGFEFNYDLSKEFNANKANIYTLIAKEPVAGNVLPLTEQITVIPVGVKIAANGDYTFAIPEGTNGVGVTLIDNETGIRTSLSVLDYTINLPAGTYNERFVLEISPIRPISTDLENTEYRIQNTDVRKVLIDNILYVVKDGVMYDAQGKRLQ